MLPEIEHRENLEKWFKKNIKKENFVSLQKRLMQKIHKLTAYF